MIPDNWPWRDLMAQAISDAQDVLGVTQSELAARLGVSREVMLRSKDQTIVPGRDYPKKGIGLTRALELCRMARWSQVKIDAMLTAWVQESLWRSARDHFETLSQLPSALQRRRWKQLARLAVERGGL